MKWSAEEVALVPPDVVTVTSTVRAVCAGEVAVHELEEPQLTAADGVDPKSTVCPIWNPVPVIVTVVPPVTGPAVGLTAVTVGGTT